MSTTELQVEAMTSTIWVCTDCMLMLANGDDSGLGPDSPEPLSLLGDEDVTCGMTFGGHDEDCAYAHGDRSAECDCERQAFSGSRCDGCGSTLGGERHAATVWSED